VQAYWYVGTAVAPAAAGFCCGLALSPVDCQ
jgi:hypothetical protein